jgi:hypothetical protein
MLIGLRNMSEYGPSAPVSKRPALWLDAAKMTSALDAETLAWLEADRIAMRSVFEDSERLDQVPFPCRTWVTPWDRWASPVVQADPSWRRSWAQVLGLARRVPYREMSDGGILGGGSPGPARRVSGMR